MAWQIAIVSMGLAAMGLAAGPLLAQDARASERHDAPHEVLAAQDAFWSAFNACDLTGMEARFTPDVEFYHDREGMQATREKVVASMLAGPCDASSDRRMRREAIPGTEAIYMLAGGYALASGEHRFLTRMDDGIERHDSIARYTALWQNTGSGWQMSRVVSYDHRADLPRLTPVPVTAGQLGALAGSYLLTDGTTVPLSMADGTLMLGEGPRAFALVPLGENRFGVEDRWLQFRLRGGRLEIFDEGRLVASGSRTAE